jgi:hypothetical protein
MDDNQYFINKAKKIHGDRYDYSEIDYKNSTTPITIICRKHGNFLQIPKSHLQQLKGCKQCIVEDAYERTKINGDKFIKKVTEKYGDRYDYSEVVYKTNKTPITIICKKHGKFVQTPNAHISATGCKQCATKSKEVYTDEFIKKATEIYDDKYDYSLVDYCDSKTKIIIICKIHGQFSQTPSTHLDSKYGCPTCATENQDYPTKITQEQYIEQAKAAHGDIYNYSKVEYKNCRTPIIIICNIHGEFTQNPRDHLKCDCPKCSNIRKASKLRKTTEEFIEEAKKVHGNTYDYSKVNYITSRIKIIIICKIHGEFLQEPSAHFLYGCRLCANDFNSNLKTCTSEQFIEKSNLIHGNKYDYSLAEYINSKTDIIITCHKHGNFVLLAARHIAGQGCQKCNTCPSCGLWRTLGKLCGYCKPKNINKLYQKTKEMDVVKFLKDNLNDIDFIYNKSVGDDCTGGRLFPDTRFDRNHYQLIVEVDEHKHRGANYKCDEQRMYDIIAKLGQPCIFIRYNPDNKNSDKNILLEKIKGYLNLDIEKDKIWDDFGFKVEYLFY